MADVGDGDLARVKFWSVTSTVDSAALNMSVDCVIMPGLSALNKPRGRRTAPAIDSGTPTRVLARARR